MTRSVRRRIIRAAIEASYGTPETLANDDAIEVSEITVEPLTGETAERGLILPYFGNSPSVVATQQTNVQTIFEMAGSGAAGTAPRYGRILQACGFSETVNAGTDVIYQPISENIPGLTVDANYDGVQHLAPGCRGTWQLNATVNDFPRFTANMTGIYTTPTDVPIPAANFGDQAPGRIFSSQWTTNFNVLGYTDAEVQTLTIDLAGAVTFQQLAGAPNPEILFTDRLPTGTITIKAPTQADKDFFTDAANSTPGPISFQHGQDAGNIFSCSMPNCTIEGPTFEELNGVQMMTLNYRPIPTTAGNDEIVFTVA